MTNKHYAAAASEESVRHARQVWIKLRLEAIHRKISAHDVLTRNGVNVGFREDREEQFACPFHGQDSKPSARLYPADARSYSHAWCFVCKERWDAVTLWQKFNGGTDDKTFTRTLTEIERAYGLETPAMPEGAALVNFEPTNGILDEFEALYAVTESRLIRSKGAYKYLSDMVGYLAAGSVLDKLRTQIEECQMSPKTGIEVLKQLLIKIGGKERQCPEG